MGTLVLNGATSGSTTLSPVDAVTATITLPSATGTLPTTLVGTYTATLTGCTTSPTYTVQYTLTGNVVTLRVGPVTGTSNSSAKSLTGMPSSLWPATQNRFVVIGLDNGSSGAPCTLNIETTGVMNLYYNVENTWTTSGTFTMRTMTVTYTLA
jgi:hypothetical protein